MEPSPRGQTESSESVRSKLRESLATSLALVSVQPTKLRDAESSLHSDITVSIAAPRPLEASTCNEHSADQNPSWENPINVNPSEPLEGNRVCEVTDLSVKSDGATESHVPKRPKLELEEDLSERLQILAAKIEAELFKLFGGVNKKYKEKGRSLLFNLKDRSNPELRERVMSGEIAPERLCSMTAEELASKELSQWRIAKAEELAHLVVLPDSDVDIRRLVRKTHKGEFQVEVEQDDSISVEVAVGGTLLSNIPAKNDETEAPEVPVVPDKIDSVDQGFPGNQPTVIHNGQDFMEEYMVEELTDASFLPAIVSLDEFMGSLDSEPFEILPVDAERAIPNSSEKGNAGVLGSHLGYLNYDSGDRVYTGSDKPDSMDVKFTRMDSNLNDGDHIELEASVKIDLEQQASHPGTASHGEQVWEGLLQLNVSALATVVAFFKSGEKTTTEDWPDFLEIKGRVRVDAFEKFLQELPLSRTRAIMVVHFSWKEGSAENGRLHICEVAESYVEDERVGFAEVVPGVELYFCPLHAKTVDMLGKHVPKEYLDTLSATDNGLIGIVVWRKPHLATSPKLHKQNSKRHLTSKRHQEKDPNNYSPNPNPNPNHTRLPPLPLDPPPIVPDPPGPTDEDNEPIDDVPPGFGPAATRDEDDLPEFDFVRGTRPPIMRLPSATNQVQPMVRTPPPRPMNAHRPVEQMRALIHKYGQTETGNASFLVCPPVNRANWQQGTGLGIEIRDWNDEDDIPEWQPQLDIRAPPPRLLPLASNFRPPPQSLPMAPQQVLTPPVVLPGLLAQQPLQPQMGIMQGPPPMLPPWQMPGTRWGPNFMLGAPSEVAITNSGMMPPCHFGGPTMNGQSYGQPGLGDGQNGMDWRPDVSRRRGF